MTGNALTDDQALVEFGASLAPLSAAQRQPAFDYATARYIDDPTAAATTNTALLARAGADLGRARAIKTQSGSSFLVRVRRAVRSRSTWTNARGNPRCGRSRLVRWSRRSFRATQSRPTHIRVDDVGLYWAGSVGAVVNASSAPPSRSDVSVRIDRENGCREDLASMREIRSGRVMSLNL
jgi:hypothetical protein